MTNTNNASAPRSTLLARVCALFVLFALPTTSLLGRVYAEADAASVERDHRAPAAQHSDLRA